MEVFHIKNYLTKTVIGLCLALSIWFSASNTSVILAQNDSDMSTKTTDVLLEEILEYSELNELILYSSVRTYVACYHDTCPALMEFMNRSDNIVKANSKYNELCTEYSAYEELTVQQNAQLYFLRWFLIEAGQSQQNARSDTIDTPTTIYTRLGTPVSALHRTGTFTQEVLDKMTEDASQYQNIVKLRSETYNYNCHSYAWYSQSENNTIWLSYPNAFKTDGCYEVSIAECRSGDIVLYRNLNEAPYEDIHSAIISSVDSSDSTDTGITVISKWGAYPLYSHNLTECPYYAQANEIKIYRFCTHSSFSYEHVNVYTHRKICNGCGYTTTEGHILNNLNICYSCGGKGLGYDYNSNFEAQIK